jgi:hypothetical protein
MRCTSITNNLSLWEAPVLPYALIHRSAWKDHSRKSVLTVF